MGISCRIFWGQYVYICIYIYIYIYSNIWMFCKSYYIKSYCIISHHIMLNSRVLYWIVTYIHKLKHLILHDIISYHIISSCFFFVISYYVCYVVFPFCEAWHCTLCFNSYYRISYLLKTQIQYYIKSCRMIFYCTLSHDMKSYIISCYGMPFHFLLICNVL